MSLAAAVCFAAAPMLVSTPAASAAPAATTTTTTVAKATTTTTVPKATTTTTVPKATTTTTTVAKGSVVKASVKAAVVDATVFPATPPAQICGNTSILNGPATAPAGAIVVAAGNNSAQNWNIPGATFYFLAGTHTLGQGIYSQIITTNNTTYEGAPGAIINGQGINDFAFTQTSSGVTIENLTIENFIAPPNQGVVNHDSGANWLITANTITANDGAGVMIGSGDSVTYNCLSNNGQYGFNAYSPAGVTNIVIDHNEISGNNTGNWEVVDPGCGCTGGGKIWNTTGAQITNNYVHNNFGPGIWADTNNAGILINGNYIANNDDEAIIYEISYNAAITDNNIIGNELVQGKAFAAAGNNFPAAAIYISESGGDARVDGGLYATFTISGNNLANNWGGVTLWEDSNRFCGATPGAGPCTIVNPAANLTTCVSGTINNAPYLSDCRWKTQNVSVTNNIFAFNAATVGCTTTAGSCGVNAIISNYGTTPSWSPYLGNAVINTIATTQNNHFADNTYTGTWQFSAGAGTVVTSSDWQGSPYNQDAGSTYNGSTGLPSIPNNLLDADTSTLEGSIGHWVPWFSDTIAQSTAQAESGTHSLQVNVTAGNGWGVQLNMWPGFTAAPGLQNIAFWAMSPTPGLNVTMSVQWRDASGNLLSTTTVPISSLGTTWQEATANATAPTGTAAVNVAFTGTNAAAGNSLYLDQISVVPGSTTLTSPQQTNLLDADTSSLEGSIGHWIPWFSDTVAQTTAQAEAGTHSLQVNVTAGNGWGVELNEWPGFAATAGPQTISFWGRLGSGTLGATMQAQWRDANGNVLATTTATIASLTTTWQQATASGTAPAGTAYVTVTFTSPTGGSGVAGNTLYLDQIVAGPSGATTPGVNLLDTNTASLEGSLGAWIPWFSDSIAQSGTYAESGSHSLQVNITAAYGWGVETNLWPGFAATAGPVNLSFWAMSGSSGLNANLEVSWLSATGTVLGTSSASLASVTSTWQEATASATAPAGTAYANVTFSGTGGAVGNTLYLDQIYVGS